MARKLRVQYPGAIYHVMNRGDRREPIFQDEADHKLFLQTLGEACQKTGWQVHAWCLMSNHFHLVIETPQANLVAGMKWLLGTYTGRFNRRHKLFGHLFSGRYKALIVDGSGTGYLKTVCDYAHLNPLRAKLLGPEQKLSSYRWSSLRYYMLPRRKRPAWLRVARLLGEHGIPRDSQTGRREFGRRMELRRRAEDGPGPFKAVRRGWCLGDKKFRKELLAQMKEQVREHHYGEERLQSQQEEAEGMVQAGLKRFGWKEADLEARPKGDGEKLKLALRLRKETTVTLKWIAERLRMGTWTHLNHLLYWQQRKRSG
jgi:REP element-mobilizing transposase RayT